MLWPYINIINLFCNNNFKNVVINNVVCNTFLEVKNIFVTISYFIPIYRKIIKFR